MDILNQLQAFLNSLIADPELAQLSFVALLGLAVFTLLVAIMLLILGLADPVKRRLQNLEPQPAVTGAAGGGGETGTAKGAGLRGLVDPMGKRLMPTEEEARSKAYNRLRHAGIRASGALNTFFGAKLGLTLLLPTLAMVAATLLRLPLNIAMLAAVSAGLVGYLLPTFWLERAIKRRTLGLRRGLPDALDLLVVSSEAGLGLGASIQRVARDLEISQPELSDELTLFGMQTRAGMDTRTALRDLEERTGVEDIRGLVTSLLQSMRFGTSIAATLRIYAAELRDKRTQEAEEKAAKVSTKMLFPLVFCVFPSFFVVALGPPLLGAFEAMSGR
ncbi:tight adherence protein C [Modicisalibacter xianhensis]|uniref:Tight adherence protein C n=1 Tax=Modicisalibacter xianhensis TaxID=442341 RepID=A0A4R8FPQ5_9GAMM|nr:type II secretion system F family protein [Halomonas xianhensis]TDX28410.1 tight adherence protein C [Halomonas xianhensis]